MVEASTIDAGTGIKSTFERYILNEDNLIGKATVLCNSFFGANAEVTCKYNYDEKGNVISVVYTANTDHVYKIEYTYDENGRLSKISTYHDGSKIGTRKYTYDENGNIIKNIYTNSSGETDVSEYTYDKNGNIIKAVNPVVDDVAVPRKTDYIDALLLDPSYLGYDVLSVEHSYDKNGNLGKISCYDYRHNVIIGTTEHSFEYDQNSNITKVVYTRNQEDNFSQCTDEFTYDSYGNIIKQVTTYNDNSVNSVTVIETSYDENNNMTDSITSYYLDGSLDGSNRNQFSYNEYGSIVKMVTTQNFSGETYINEYKYEFVYSPYYVEDDLYNSDITSPCYSIYLAYLSDNTIIMPEISK